MNKEVFDKCIYVVKTIDAYIRSIDENNIDEYDDFYPFTDYNDISLYKDIDKTTIINYTVGIILKSDLDLKNDKNMFFVSIVSYILTIKYITDCSLYKPYTFFLNFLKELELTETPLESKIDKNKKIILEKIIKLERIILDNINYFCKNEN